MACTRSATSKALVPGSWKTTRPTDGLAVEGLAVEVVQAPISTWPTSRRRTTASDGARGPRPVVALLTTLPAEGVPAVTSEATAAGIPPLELPGWAADVLVPPSMLLSAAAGLEAVPLDGGGAAAGRGAAAGGAAPAGWPRRRSCRRPRRLPRPSGLAAGPVVVRRWWSRCRHAGGRRAL